MTYKGIYCDGIVTLLGDVDFRNGATIDVNLRGKDKSTLQIAAELRTRAARRGRNV